MNDPIAAHRQRQANVISIAAALVCALCSATALVPGVELAVTLVLAAAALALVLLGARLVRRWLRERREDRDDALTAAAWRAENARSHVARLRALDNVHARSGRGVS